MYKICIYVPRKFKENVKAAMFEAGAGKSARYKEVCFEISGIGQFYPLVGSNPSYGKHHRLKRIAEVKIETVCKKKCLAKVIQAIKQAHPYEQPAIDIIKLCLVK